MFDPTLNKVKLHPTRSNIAKHFLNIFVRPVQMVPFIGAMLNEDLDEVQLHPTYVHGQTSPWNTSGAVYVSWLVQTIALFSTSKCWVDSPFHSSRKLNKPLHKTEAEVVLAQLKKSVEIVIKERNFLACLLFALL